MDAFLRISRLFSEFRTKTLSPALDDVLSFRKQIVFRDTIENLSKRDQAFAGEGVDISMRFLDIEARMREEKDEIPRELYVDLLDNIEKLRGLKNEIAELARRVTFGVSYEDFEKARISVVSGLNELLQKDIDRNGGTIFPGPLFPSDAPQK